MKKNKVKWTNAEYFLRLLDDLRRKASDLSIRITEGDYGAGREFLAVVQEIYFGNLRFLYDDVPKIQDEIDKNIFHIRRDIIGIGNKKSKIKACKELQKIYYNISFFMGVQGVLLPNEQVRTSEDLRKAMGGEK